MTPTIEGAGVKLQRAFGFGKTKDFDPFLLLDDFRNHKHLRKITGPDFPGIRIEGSRRSRMRLRARLSTATVWIRAK